MPVHVCKASFNSVVVETEPLVIDAEQMQDRRVQVVNRRNLFLRPVPEFVCRAVGVPGFHAGSCEPNGESLRIVITSIRAFLKSRHPPKLSDKSHKRVGKKAALLEVL